MVVPNTITNALRRATHRHRGVSRWPSGKSSSRKDPIRQIGGHPEGGADSGDIVGERQRSRLQNQPVLGIRRPQPDCPAHADRQHQPADGLSGRLMASTTPAIGNIRIASPNSGSEHQVVVRPRGIGVEVSAQIPVHGVDREQHQGGGEHRPRDPPSRALTDPICDCHSTTFAVRPFRERYDRPGRLSNRCVTCQTWLSLRSESHFSARLSWNSTAARWRWTPARPPRSWRTSPFRVTSKAATSSPPCCGPSTTASVPAQRCGARSRRCAPPWAGIG